MVGQSRDSGRLSGRVADGGAGELLLAADVGKKERYQGSRFRAGGLQEESALENRGRPYVRIQRTDYLGLPAAILTSSRRLAHDYIREGFVDHPHAAPAAGRREVPLDVARDL